MKLPTSLFLTVVLAVVLAATTAAAPSPPNVKLTGVVGREISLGRVAESFHPTSSFETFGQDGISHPLLSRGDFDIKNATISFIQSRLNIDPDTIAFGTNFSHDVAYHVYVKQQHNGIPITNAVANVAFNKARKVVSFGSSFIKPTSVSASNATITVQEAIYTAESTLSGKYNNHPPKLEYVAKKDGSLVLAHVVQIQDFDKGLSIEAFVDAHSSDIVHLTDFAAHASYYALPVYKQSPDELFELTLNPQLATASPWGWHSIDNVTILNETSGNNAVSYIGTIGNLTGPTSATLNFDYPRNSLEPPTYILNSNAARVNAFYVVNALHDISYLYGFTEQAFNFQQNNMGKGGLGNDRINVSVQDTGESGNAHFYYSPDGQPGYLRLGIFTDTLDPRDSAFANDVIVHEFTHGITTRMTGGGTGQCIQQLESTGLGEGWSDALADWMAHTTEIVTDYVIGAWLTGTVDGLRRYPYSTIRGVNPLQYQDGLHRQGAHDIGEIWANMLHNVYAALVGVHGFDADARTDATGKAGNTVWLHLFIDALALQPCNPTFINARDAWIQADQNRYNGTNFCTLWKAFASRGLGEDAAPNYVNGFNVPPGC